MSALWCLTSRYCGLSSGSLSVSGVSKSSWRTPLHRSSLLSSLRSQIFQDRQGWLKRECQDPAVWVHWTTWDQVLLKKRRSRWRQDKVRSTLRSRSAKSQCAGWCSVHARSSPTLLWSTAPRFCSGGLSCLQRGSTFSATNLGTQPKCGQLWRHTAK